MLLLSVVAGCCAPAQQTAVESTYTSLTASACKVLSVREEGANSIQRCPGVGGFSLLVLDSDARQSVTVVAPDGRKSPLKFWDVITHSFSSLGAKAEWRVSRTGARIRPMALIVRVNANENPDGGATSYLAVVKITAEATCVVSKIGPASDANTIARQAADASSSKPCLKSSD